MTNAPRRSATNRSPHGVEAAEIRRLWAEQEAYFAECGTFDADVDYVRFHLETDIALRRRLMNLDMIVPYLRGRALDWGCQHGIDACVYRMRLGDSVELHGADVFDPRAFKPMFETSGLEYVQLDHPYRTPYPSECFDVVVGNGVLEHVPMPEASAREVARILAPGGVFVVSCLPNRLSYTEAGQRWFVGHPGHDRLYTIRGARRLLESSGLKVEWSHRYWMVPTMLTGLPARLKRAYERLDRPLWALNSVLERAWPLNRLASNLLLIARKPVASQRPARSRRATRPTSAAKTRGSAR